MTQEELYRLLGHADVQKDLDIKTMVLDLIRERFSQEEILSLFWAHLSELDESYVRGYLYRRFS